MKLLVININICRYISIFLIAIFMSMLLGCAGTKKISSMALMVPENHGLSADQFSVQPGMSESRGNLEFSCPAEGSACNITVTADGSVSYSAAGGTPTVEPALNPLNSPMNHGLTADQFSVQPGMSESRGNVEFSCPAEGSACNIMIADDGSVSYSAVGGTPTVLAASRTLSPPMNHGLTADQFSVQPGMSESRGNVEFSCPAEGSACNIMIADDGSVSYSAVGGTPTVLAASRTLSPPMNHGLTADQFSVQPGMSESRGNVEFSCPAEGSACNIMIADDGSVSYSAVGGTPTVLAAMQPLSPPMNHGLSPGQFAVQPGMSETRGNVKISCPSGDYACRLTAAEDGMVTYDLSGGMPTVTLLPVLQVRAGLSKSLNETVNSNDANNIPFDQLILNSENVFAPITTALDRISGDPSSAESSDAAIKSISSDGDGGYFVTFVIDDEEWIQHYTKQHYLPNFDSFGSKSEDNAPFSNGVWFERTGFTYFAVYGGQSSSLDPNKRSRLYFIGGAKTGKLPDATARYVGSMKGEIWRNANQLDRTHVSGVGVLRANFGESTVNGEISKIRVRPESSDSYSSLEDNRFIIETGNIENGQFLANLRGADSSSDLSDTQNSNEVIASIEGFSGNVLGEFFGPQANEVGAVLNATRRNAVLFGYMTGSSPFNPTGPLEQANSAPLDATVKRDFSDNNRSVELSDDSTQVVSIQSNDSGGITLTYMVDGTQYSVQFEDSDVVSSSSYNKVSNNRDQWVWTNSNGFSTPDFKYINSYYFSSRALGGTQHPLSLFVNGLQTDVDNIPSGRATYLGKAWIDSWTDCCLNFRDRASTKGNLSLRASFVENTIRGSIDEIEYRRNAGSSFISVPNANGVISDGTIDGNKFSANLEVTGATDEFSGEMSGAFYGPAAQEVGGVIKTTSTSNSVGIGWFGGSREAE